MVDLLCYFIVRVKETRGVRTEVTDTVIILQALMVAISTDNQQRVVTYVPSLEAFTRKVKSSNQQLNCLRADQEVKVTTELKKSMDQQY